MRLRRWHRLGIILTIIGAIGVFYCAFTWDDELGEDVYFHQVNECRVAERRGLPADKCYRAVEREHAAVVREKWQQAALVTAAALMSAWLAAFLSIGLYRWVMAGAPNSRPGDDPGRGAGRRSRERIEPKIQPARASTMRIGILSDTHGLLRPEAVERLAGVRHIVHAGDIGRPEVISELRKIAPVTAVRGNVDRAEWAAGYPHTALVTLAGRRILRASRSPGAGSRSRGGRHRCGRVRSFASSENRNLRRRALSQPGKRRAAPFHPARCPRDARARPPRAAAAHP